MKASQLNLGYQYIKTLDMNNTISLTKDNGVYFIKGFVNCEPYFNSFTLFNEAKKEFNKILRKKKLKTENI